MSDEDEGVASNTDVVAGQGNEETLAMIRPCISESLAVAEPEIDTADTLKPSQRVILSEDLLPLILLDLKAMAELEDDKLGRWRHVLAPLLLVNQAYFHATANLLWRTMNSLAHAFRLLPWFTPTYTGIGTHQYTGSGDWKRFNLYACRIQHFNLKLEPDILASTAGFMELYTLPGRPDPFFPALSSVTLGPAAIHGTPLLFLLVSPSLRFLHVNTVGSTNIFRWSSKAPADNFMNVLPQLAFSARRLHTFDYTGSTNDAFFDRLSTFTSLKSISLASNTRIYLGNLLKLRTLLSLRNIAFTIPFLAGGFTKQGIVQRPLPVLNKSRYLDSLHITAQQYSQCLIARSLPLNRVRNLHLQFVHMTEVIPFHLCLALYLEANAKMETVEVRIIENNPQGEDLDSTKHGHEWPTSTEASDLLLSTIKRSERLREFHLLEFPLEFAASAHSILEAVIMSCASLTNLRFTIKLDSSSQTPPTPPTPPPHFPGLSFLASTIWEYSHNLTSLDLHLSVAHIMEEDLSLDDHDRTASPASSRGHNLQHLNINTGKTLAESIQLELLLSRKIEISKFLDRLFPNLLTVRGSAEGFWAEIDLLVKSYQEQREGFVREVEALLGTYRSA